MIKETPILFSGEMVRAILEGRKTQTRRLIKPQPVFDRPRSSDEVNAAWQEGFIPEPCPYGMVGDKLWVRESFYCLNEDSIIYAADEHSNILRKRPSIHMPKKLCRIWLEITDVSIERLNDITGDDSIDEGAWRKEWREIGRASEAIASFKELWESINGEGSWADNPWVWVVEFERRVR